MSNNIQRNDAAIDNSTTMDMASSPPDASPGEIMNDGLSFINATEVDGVALDAQNNETFQNMVVPSLRTNPSVAITDVSTLQNTTTGSEPRTGWWVLVSIHGMDPMEYVHDCFMGRS